MMPELLPPTIREEIVWLLTPRREFKLAQDRIDLIDPCLAGWPERHDLDWSGAPHPFFERLVRATPGPQLTCVLQSLLIGEIGEQQVADLCQRIDTAVRLVTEPGKRPFSAYYQTVA